MDLETQIRDLFPSADHSCRALESWSVQKATDELFQLACGLDQTVTLFLVRENDLAQLAFRTDDSDQVHLLKDRYAYSLRLVMAHLSTRFDEESTSPYESHGSIKHQGQTVEIEFCNQPGRESLRLEAVHSVHTKNRELAVVH